MATPDQDQTPTRIDSQTLHAMMLDIFRGLGVPQPECAIVAESLLEASLAGYDSHGIMRVSMYTDDIRKGAMVPNARLEIVQQTPASVHLDAHFGLGPVAATEAVRLAAAKAEHAGVGCVGVANASDIGRLGGYVRKPAESGLVALMMVNDAGGGPWVAPWGSTQPFLSTNPIAAAIPWRDELPIVIDISTSVVAGGKLKMLANRDQNPPEGWLVDRQGDITTDLASFFTVPKQGALLPLGGLVAGHKGFALSLLVDILAGALGGSGCSSGEESELNRNGVFVLVIDPDKFVSRTQFNQGVEQLLDKIKNAERSPHVDEILIPGERAHRERQQRLEEGIPVDGPTLDALKRIVGELDLTAKYPL